MTFRRGVVSSARFTPDGQSFVYSASWEGEPYARVSRPVGEPGRTRSRLTGRRILSISRASDMAVLFGPQNDRNGRSACARWQAFRWRAALAAICSTASSMPTGFPAANDLAVIRDPGGGRPWTVEFPAGTTVHEARAAWSLRVSPDGSRIAFFEGPALFDGATDANRHGDRSGRAQDDRLARNWTALGLAWAPSGREIWFTATRQNARTR